MGKTVKQSKRTARQAVEILGFESDPPAIPTSDRFFLKSSGYYSRRGYFLRDMLSAWAAPSVPAIGVGVRIGII